MPWTPLFAALLAGTAPAPVTVSELFWGMSRFDGQVVRVSGWLGPCDRKICWLTDGPLFSAGVTMASSDSIDQAAKTHPGSMVVVEGTVRAMCRAGRWSTDNAADAPYPGCRPKTGTRVGVLQAPRIVVTTTSR